MLEHMCGDRSFKCPTQYFMSALLKESKYLPISPHAEEQPSRYFYSFCYSATSDSTPEWMGVTHGAEVQVGTLPPPPPP